VALRVASFGWLALIVVALRLLLVPLGYTIEGDWEWATCVVVFAAGLGLSLLRSLWLVRAAPQALAEQVQWACKGLFLSCTEERNAFLLCEKGVTERLRWFSLSRGWQLLVLPPRAGAVKIALLIDWLAKQYPGPFPRMRIVLKKGVNHGNGDI
jgi:hypothetical protein